MISGCLTFCLVFGTLLSPFLFLADVIMGKELRFDWISTPITIIMFIFYICVFYCAFFGKNGNDSSNNNINKYKDYNNKSNLETKKYKKTYKAKNDNSFIE